MTRYIPGTRVAGFVYLPPRPLTTIRHSCPFFPESAFPVSTRPTVRVPATCSIPSPDAPWPDTPLDGKPDPPDAPLFSPGAQRAPENTWICRPSFISRLFSCGTGVIAPVAPHPSDPSGIPGPRKREKESRILDSRAISRAALRARIFLLRVTSRRTRREGKYYIPALLLSPIDSRRSLIIYLTAL